jgi:hypothetical protein
LWYFYKVEPFEGKTDREYGYETVSRLSERSGFPIREKGKKYGFFLENFPFNLDFCLAVVYNILE